MVSESVTTRDQNPGPSLTDIGSDWSGLTATGPASDGSGATFGPGPDWSGMISPPGDGTGAA